ncbi:MAG TPA: MBL fold metallo-hydrolase [Tepidisphaeraceae bacterium]|nr:MBL fold metallo-hydrolase [Tepidisphaeraceae bacterium]
MSIELCVLASGSSGNCCLVRTPAGVLMIDAGIGPRLAARRMMGTGVGIADIAAVCLTHLDRDHFSPYWVSTFIKHGIRIFCHAGRVEELLAACEDENLAALVHGFDDQPFEALPMVDVHPIPLAHDAQGSHGFVLDGFGHRLGYATDLGHVPGALLDHFTDLDLLALESNYDPAMQEQSGRPIFLQRRITGGWGHLSNEQALWAIRQIFDRAQRAQARLPSHIVLLHRSRQCNCPRLVRKLFSRDARIAARLTLAEQFQRTEWLARRGRRVAAGEQLLLAWE